AACRLGGIVGEGSEEKKEALTLYGRFIGTAFQLTDDALDYSADRDRLGKSLGNDLQEGKITLPLLHLLRTCKDGDLRRVREIIASDQRTEKDLAFIQELLHRNHSLEYALSLAREYAAKARETLAPFEEPAPCYQALMDLTDFVVERDL
ncbi:MAG: polyprenyl synthetase family protein, partial [Nitrospirae bacterium]|nr:polyprenyl synthetase family protein [Nitrospirota bacterium]